ncbi:mitochondrial ribosomal protein S31 [Oratosquilla oratoria]|uniref:mitochondrial ribosomal protein S31 n=1 Tax=Oratosquilla oratoria TaxID=337810 RepID=UPI003F758241
MSGYLARGIQTRNYIARLGQCRLKYAAQRRYCENKNDESPPTTLEASPSDEKKNAARQRLNDLLSSLATSDTIPVEKLPEVQLSRPKQRKKKEKAVELPSDGIDEEVAVAAKDVAESLGGDTAKTESELLSALKSHAENVSSTAEEDKEAVNISNLFIGMKVERSRKSAAPESRTRRVYKRGLDVSEPQTIKDTQPDGAPRAPAQFRRKREYKRVDLFGSDPLNIFSKEKEYTGATSNLPTWRVTHDRELQLMVSHPPANGFEEMIQWTKQGKMWQFPVDNEYGLEDGVGFHEHIFLEQHLEDWCPKRGPIRHFMELVCTGLSKNPYLTVERKKNHIMWYKTYFEDKESVLKEIGAI